MSNISENIFMLPVDDLTADFRYIYYAPLSHRVSASRLDELPADKNLPHTLNTVADLRKMSILPNHRCNFSCTYCYAAQGRNSDELTVENVEKALNFFIDARRTKRPLSLAVLGGGEPMLSWPLVRHIISAARLKAKEEGLRLELTVVTNASILDDEIIRTFKENDVIVNASFDLLENVQDTQRKSFSQVKDNIYLMSSQGVYTTINSTITPLNVGNMIEMVVNAHNWSPKIRYMIFEPVISASMFQSTRDLRAFYDAFILNFDSAFKKATQFGIDLTCRILKSLGFRMDRGCEGRFNICPNGDITICYCASSKQDPNFANRVFGRVDEHGVTIFSDKFNRITNENVYAMTKCDNCFARYNCAGGCMLPNDRYNEEYLNEVCRFNREFIRRELLKKVVK